MTATLDFTKLRLLRSDTDYDAAVTEIDRLLDADPVPGTEEADRLEVLSLLVEQYDSVHFPLGGKSTPQSVVLFMLEQQGRTRADLVPLLGSRSRVSEFLTGKRRLSMAQIAALKKELRIPADLLIDSGDTEIDTDVNPPPASEPARAVESIGVAHPPLGQILGELLAAQRDVMHQVADQMAVHTSALKEALAAFRGVTAAHQYALQQYAAATNTAYTPSASALGTLPGQKVNPYDYSGSNVSLSVTLGPNALSGH